MTKTPKFAFVLGFLCSVSSQAFAQSYGGGGWGSGGWDSSSQSSFGKQKQQPFNQPSQPQQQFNQPTTTQPNRPTMGIIEKEIIPLDEVVERIKPDATKIIFELDKVECYGVARKSLTYPGATLNGWAINGKCGELTKEGYRNIQTNVFATRGAIDFDERPKCTVDPKVILRFSRGIDNVDVLFSHACPFVRVMYAGQTTDLNFEPSKTWLEAFIRGVSESMTPIEMAKDIDPEEEKLKNIDAPKVWTIQKPPQFNTPNTQQPLNQTPQSTQPQTIPPAGQQQTIPRPQMGGTSQQAPTPSGAKVKRAWDK